MRILVILSTFLIWALGAKAAELILPQPPQKAEDISIKSNGFDLFGTMQLPEAKKNLSILLLISGSGPTDRDGNQPNLTNNSLKYLAEDLSAYGIASLRYDKRGIAKSYYPGFTNASILFDDYVSDASSWIKYLKAQNQFTKVYVAGLSEGSLIGMLAALQAGADGFISINGPGRPADEIILHQISKQGTPEEVLDQVKSMILKVKAGERFEEVPPYLLSLFQPDIQPYLKSWFQYNPAVEIGKLKVPVLIVQGENDIQVEVKDALLLKAGNEKAQLKRIEGMNHILKDAPEDLQQNYATYTNPDLPLNKVLLKEIVTFIQQ
ncbi:MAG: alpha/beta hydrolase [Prolixibacteraceae bacterium]